GNGTISNGGLNAQFNDNDWLAVDRGTSRYRGSVYVTWARQQYRKDVQTESPIFFVRSRDGGVTWTVGAEISGASPMCSGQGSTGPRTRCDQNDAGFSSPIVAPDGRRLDLVETGPCKEQRVRSDLSMGGCRSGWEGSCRLRRPGADRTARASLRVWLHPGNRQ